MEGDFSKEVGMKFPEGGEETICMDRQQVRQCIRKAAVQSAGKQPGQRPVGRGRGADMKNTSQHVLNAVSYDDFPFQ